MSQGRILTSDNLIMPLQYLLFDVDETLYPHTSPLWPLLRGRILQYMVERVGMSPPDAEALRAEYLKKYGTTTRGLYLHNAIDMADYLDYVHDVPINTLLVNDPELNEVLSQLPFAKCLFTNATRRHALNVAASLGISQHFSRTFSLEDFDYISKPEARPYQVVLDSLGARGGDCVLIEDSVANIATGKQFGMTTILVDGDLPPSAGVVDFTVRRVHDILDVVRRLPTP
ncbi:MAG: pyrimidine 5'-nucleotidase [Chloroflexi bacterium]|nr:pyrimidine 5'-nucleotidase [Chloroflexota bacterium]